MTGENDSTQRAQQSAEVLRVKGSLYMTGVKSTSEPPCWNAGVTDEIKICQHPHWRPQKEIKKKITL
jgi:hypothetical protein